MAEADGGRSARGGEAESDPAFAHYLNLRAAALLSDDYYASDVAWLELKNPKVDLIFAPYETYLDGLLGVKTSYGALDTDPNDAESRKLALYQQQEAAMQQALPVAAADKPSKEGQATPMEVADAPLRAGDLHYGYQAVADNLPNDPRIHAEKGSKKIFFKNFMDLRVNNVILPIAGKMLAPEQATDRQRRRDTDRCDPARNFAWAGAGIRACGWQADHINEAIGPVYRRAGRGQGGRDRDLSWRSGWWIRS